MALGAGSLTQSKINCGGKVTTCFSNTVITMRDLKIDWQFLDSLGMITALLVL